MAVVWYSYSYSLEQKVGEREAGCGCGAGGEVHCARVKAMLGGVVVVLGERHITFPPRQVT